MFVAHPATATLWRSCNPSGEQGSAATSVSALAIFSRSSTLRNALQINPTWVLEVPGPNIVVTTLLVCFYLYAKKGCRSSRDCQLFCSLTLSPLTTPPQRTRLPTCRPCPSFPKWRLQDSTWRSSALAARLPGSMQRNREVDR